MKKLFFLMVMCISTITQAATEIRVLKQPGQSSNQPLLYATVKHFERMTKEKNLDVKIVYQPMGASSDAVRSMLAGNTDIIMSAIDTFTLANDRDPGRLLLMSGSMSQAMDLICSNPSIKTPNDIKPHHRIAMKNLGSSEHYLVRQIAKKYKGKYDAFDGNLVAIPRPQIAALMSAKKNTIDCAIPGTPLQASLVSQGHAHTVFSSDNRTVFGNVHATYSRREWLEKNPQLAELWIRAVDLASKDITRDPKPAIEEFRTRDGIKDSTDDIADIFKKVNQRHGIQFVGVMEKIKIMHDIGSIKNLPSNVNTLVWRPELLK